MCVRLTGKSLIHGNEPLPLLSIATMAEEKKTDTSTDSIDATMKATEENLASLRKTMEAIDGLEARWKVRNCKLVEVFIIHHNSY